MTGDRVWGWGSWRCCLIVQQRSFSAQHQVRICSRGLPTLVVGNCLGLHVNQPSQPSPEPLPGWPSHHCFCVKKSLRRKRKGYPWCRHQGILPATREGKPAEKETSCSLSPSAAAGNSLEGVTLMQEKGSLRIQFSLNKTPRQSVRGTCRAPSEGWPRVTGSHLTPSILTFGDTGVEVAGKVSVIPLQPSNLLWLQAGCITPWECRRGGWLALPHKTP